MSKFVDGDLSTPTFLSVRLEGTDGEGEEGTSRRTTMLTSRRISGLTDSSFSGFRIFLFSRVFLTFAK